MLALTLLRLALHLTNIRGTMLHGTIRPTMRVVVAGLASSNAEARLHKIAAHKEFFLKRKVVRQTALIAAMCVSTPLSPLFSD